MSKESLSGWGEKLKEWKVPAAIIAGILGLVAIAAAVQGMSNPEFEPDIVKSIDANGFSEKQSDLQVDTKDTVRQQVKQVNDLKGQRSGTITLGKKKKEPEVIFKR